MRLAVAAAALALGAEASAQQVTASVGAHGARVEQAVLQIEAPAASVTHVAPYHSEAQPSVGGAWRCEGNCTLRVPTGAYFVWRRGAFDAASVVDVPTSGARVSYASRSEGSLAGAVVLTSFGAMGTVSGIGITVAGAMFLGSAGVPLLVTGVLALAAGVPMLVVGVVMLANHRGGVAIAPLAPEASALLQRPQFAATTIEPSVPLARLAF